MLGYLPAIILQTVGVIIPLVGIIVLMRKGQGKENTFLVMANFGALIMNWAYLQMLRASDFQSTVSIYKFEYIGSVLFFLFFVLFLRSFLLRERVNHKFAILFLVFFLVETVSLLSVLFDSPLAYETMDVRYRKDDGNLYTRDVTLPEGVTAPIEILKNPNAPVKESETEETQGNLSEKVELGEVDGQPTQANEAETSEELGRGYASVYVGYGIILQIRYCLLTVILGYITVQSLYLAIKRKVREERTKILYVTGAEIVVFVSLLISVFRSDSFDIAPFLVSCSVMSIICGTASGNFFTIADRGRGWVLDHSDVIFVIVDKEYHFLDANDFAKKVFPSLQELPIHSIIPEEFKDAVLCEKCDFEWNGRRYSKKMAPIETKGRVIGHSIVFVDMTEQHQLMEQLELEKQKAIDANEAKSNFMSNMSHEIRTPMNAIVGMTEIMLRHEQDDFNTEYLNNIKNSGNALLAVVNDILDFSKIESGKLEIIPDEYEIMSVLNDLSMIFLNRIGEKPLELIYDIDPKLPIRLCGDAVRIRQVLLNIVNNGIKYSEEGYVKLIINVEAISEEELMLHCAVEDTGIGIKKEDLPKLFSTFSQVDTKRNRGKEGTGLGLSIAKQLVEAMDGSFSVESEYGKGSTFCFSMKQQVVDWTPAARVKGKQQVYVTGFMNQPECLEIIQKMCEAYEQVFFVNPEDAISGASKALDYVFVDRNTYLNAEFREEEKSIMAHFRPEWISVYNPMLEQCDQKGITLMNKPLYTLNFCLALNHEVMNFQQNQEKSLSFAAPTASILIVDDNEMNRKVAAGLLEPLQMQIDMAVDGKQAVEKILAKEYDLVFMDHMMPIMDGIEATTAIRDMEGDYYKKLPIIALSANALSEAKRQFTEVGMNDFLAKPIKTKELFKIVKKYLPPEKVEERLEEAIEPFKEEAFPVIEGLDVAAGVENSGGLKLFLSLLGDFYKLIDRKAVKIEKCLSDGLLRDFTIEVHALKNTARMIGALELSEQFYEMEQAGNAENLDLIQEKIGDVLALYRSYKPILESYAAVDNETKEEMSVENLRRTIEALKTAMDGFDLDGADEAMKTLENSRVPELIRMEIEDLGALVADVAMDEVIQLCDKLLAKIET